MKQAAMKDRVGETMVKFKVGDRVGVIKGYWMGKIGTITAINLAADGVTVPEAWYMVAIDGSTTEKALREGVLDANLSIARSFTQNYIEDRRYEGDDLAGIHDSAFCEMCTLQGGFMGIKLTVFNYEDGVPHFHFYRGLDGKSGVPSEQRSFGGCICLLEAKYLIHEKHQSTMTAEEIEGLVAFLKAPSPLGISNWRLLLGGWNAMNGEQLRIHVDLPTPKYKSDMGYIHI